MAQYDGSIRINTKIDTKGFKDGEKEIESESRRMAESVSKTADQIEKELENLKNAQKYFLEAGGNKKSPIYQEYEKDVKRLRESLKSLNDTQSDTKISDEHLNQLKIDVEEYAKTLKELQKQGKFFGDEEYDKVYLSWKNATDAVKAYQAELNKQTESGQAKIAEQEAKAAEKKEAAQRRAEEQAERNLQRENERIQKQIENETKLAAKEAERQAKIQAEAAEEERLAQIKANATVSDQQILNLLEHRKQLISEIKDMEAAGVGLGYKQYEDANRELEEVNGKIKDYRKNLDSVPEKFEKMRKSANKAFNTVANGTKKSSGLLSTFASRLKGLALSLLIFNWISKAFNAMISGMKKGFENFMGYSDSYAQSIQNMKNAMSTLGNQFAAAFAPIVQMVVPWLNSLINALTTAMAHVSQFFAILGGKSTFTRAVQIQDKYNKALGGTAAAAKKAYGALAKFDDLDVLQKQDDASSGAGGMEQTLPENMFEEVPVNAKLQNWLSDILDKLRELKNIFMEGFWDGLGDWEYRWESIKDSIASIKDSLIDIWTDSNVLSAADAWMQSVAYMLGSLSGSMASIGLTIAANLLGGIAKYLEQNKERIKKYLVSMFEIKAEINYLFADLFQSIAYVFEAFASEQGQQLTANIIGIFSSAFMGITEISSKFARDILNAFIQPFVDNKEEFRTALEGFLGVLSEATGTIKDGIDETFAKLNEVYDEHFKPFFDSIASGLSTLVGQFLEFWNGNVQPILDRWAEMFDALWKEHLQPAVNGFIDLLANLANGLKFLWETLLQPLVSWISGTLLTVIMGVISVFVTKFMFIAGVVGDVIRTVMDTLNALIDFIVNIFKGNFDAAFNTLIEDAKTIGTNLIEGIKNGILGAWDSLKNTVIDTASGIGEWFCSVLGIHSPSTVMEGNGAYLIEGLKNGILNNINSVFELFSVDKWAELGQVMLDGIAPSIEAMRDMLLAGFSDAFTAIYEQLTLFIENWRTIFEEWALSNQELYFGYEAWYALFENVLLAYTEVFSEFMEQWNSNMETWWTEMVEPFFDAIKWRVFGMQMKDGIITGLKTIVAEIGGLLNSIITLFNAAFKKLEEAMNDLIEDYNKAAREMGTPTLDKVSYKAMATVSIPKLATGAVIRGGNPFMAILGDQPAGQTNIEAPLATIEQAVENVMSRRGYGSERVPVNINLNWDGETFARLSISDILSELVRQGYDVDVLGVT